MCRLTHVVENITIELTYKYYLAQYSNIQKKHRHTQMLWHTIQKAIDQYMFQWTQCHDLECKLILKLGMLFRYISENCIMFVLDADGSILPEADD